MFRNRAAPFVAGLAFTLFSIPALADGGIGDLSRLADRAEVSAAVPAGGAEEDGALRLTPDKNELVRLDQDAASVIVNNPAHAEVLLDSPRLLIVMPRQPGTTSFTVLNALGETILQKNIIVTSVQSKYVRIRRICSGSDGSCVPAAYYYCPDGCYEVTPVVQAGGGPPPPPSGGGGPRITAGSAPDTAEGSSESAAPDAPQDMNPVDSDNEPVTSTPTEPTP
ncbi:MAG: pilus assembly protein N-terminal domain-containing protein [Pseudomonadota bacterium]